MPVSANGRTHLLPASDGWIAVSLARESDVESIPAWLGADIAIADIAAAVRARTTRELVDQAVLLGMPVAALNEAATLQPVLLASFSGEDRRSTTQEMEGVVVLDLSSLWAGPLAAKLLGDRGARVIKAESTQRPDNLRAGRPDLYDELNCDKEHVTFDWSDPDELRALIDKADVVIESSRPRALAHVGIDAEAILSATDGPRVWASISGYGRSANRVAFGDDAAVAGGLVAYAADGTPRFKGDALADPLTGVRTANEIESALCRGGRWLLDIAMAGVAAEVAREGTRAPED